MRIRQSILTFIFVVTALFAVMPLFAEGSRTLYPDENTLGGRAVLYSGNPNNSYVYMPFPTRGTHYVWVRGNETIQMASSAQWFYDGTNGNANTFSRRIRLYGPDGKQIALDYGTATNKRGHIANRDQEKGGPLLPSQPLSNNRYRPIEYTVPEGKHGIYRVEFDGTRVSSTDSPLDGRARRMGRYTSWTQPYDANYIVAWDVSVLSGPQTGWYPGRVYTNVLNMDNDQRNHGETIYFTPDRGFYGIFYVVTNDGYVYRVNNNGQNGLIFTFMANNRGFHAMNGNTPDPTRSSYGSVYANQLEGSWYARNRLTDPRKDDTATEITHKIFYTYPGEHLFESALKDGKEHWLRPKQKSFSVSNFKVESVDGTSNMLSHKGGYISFDSEVAADYTITIGPGTGSTFKERVITGRSKVGTNRIYVSGRDGNNNALPGGLSPVKVTINLQGAEVHFPYIDVEQNANGIIIERLNPNQTVASDIVYWNDHPIDNRTGIIGSKANPINASHTVGNGRSSRANGHKWATNTTATSGTWGDDVGIDTWAFIRGSTFTNSNVQTSNRRADLAVTHLSADRRKLSLKEDTIIYTVKVKNFSQTVTVNEAFLWLELPTSLENKFFYWWWQGEACAELVDGWRPYYNSDTRTIRTKVNLPPGCETTFRFKAALSSEDDQNRTARAVIMRPPDIEDPDATNTSNSTRPRFTGTVGKNDNLNSNYYYSPTNPFFEIRHNGKNGVSNNIRTYEFGIIYHYANDDIAQANKGETVMGNVLDNDVRVKNHIKSMRGLDKEGNPINIPTNGTPTTIYDKKGNKAGQITLNKNGSYTFVSDPDFVGTVPVDYTVEGTNDEDVHGKLTIEMLPVYDPLENNSPVAQDTYLVVNKNGTVDGNVITSGNDPDKDNLRVSRFHIPLRGWRDVAPAGNTNWRVWLDENEVPIGRFDIYPDGTFQFRAEANYVGPVPPITYTICDNSMTPVCDDAIINIRVIDPVDPLTDIIVRDDAHFAPQGASMSGNVKDNDEWYGINPRITAAVVTVGDVQVPFDITKTSVQNLVVDGKKIGTLQFNAATGAYNLVPEPDFTGNVKVDYTVRNNEGDVGTGTLTMTSTLVKPLANDDSNQVNEGGTTSGNLLTNDIVYNGPMTVASGKVMNSEGKMVDAAVGTPVEVYGYDKDGNVQQAGTITLHEDGSYNYDALDGFNGTVPVNYTAKDAKGLTDGAKLNIKVVPSFYTGVNNPPVAQDDQVATRKGKAVSGNLLDNDIDPDGGALTLTEIEIEGVGKMNVPAGGLKNQAVKDVHGNVIGHIDVYTDGRYNFTPVSNYVGVVPPMKYRVCDDGYPKKCDTAELKLTVAQGVVTAPISAGNDSHVAPKGVTMNGNVLDNDQGEGISVKRVTYMDSEGNIVTGAPSANKAVYVTDKEGNVVKAGVFTMAANGTYTFMPEPDFIGIVPVEYAIADKNGDESSAMLFLTSLDIIEPPVVVNDDVVQGGPNESVSGNVLENDIGAGLNVVEMTGWDEEGKPLSIPIDGTATTIYDKNGNKAGTVKMDEDGNFTFTPEPGFSGKIPLEHIVVDSEGNEESSKLTIEILPLYDPLKNNPPVIQDVYNTINQGEKAIGSLVTTDNDPDGDVLTVTEVDIPGVGKVTIPPSGLKNQPIKDSEGNVIGKIDISSNGSYTFTPETGYFGEIPPIEYSVCDNGTPQFCDDAELNLKVVNQIVPPTEIFIRDDAQFAPQGRPIGGNVKDNDEWNGTEARITEGVITVDGQEIPFDFSNASPQHLNLDGKKIGTLLFDSGTGEYYLVPEPDFIGTVNVNYTVENNEGKSSSGSLIMSSTPVKPLVKDDINQVPVNGSARGDVLANDLSNNGPLTIESSKVMNSQGEMVDATVGTPVEVYGYDTDGNIVKAGSVTLNADGTYSYDAKEGFTGSVPVDYKITDTIGLSDDGQLSIRVISDFDKETNNPPVGQDIAIITNKGKPAKGNLIDSSNDPDPDRGISTITEITVPGIENPIEVGSGVTGIEVKDGEGNVIGKIDVDPDGNFTFTPEGNYVGKVPPIGYKICDDGVPQECDRAELKVTVAQEAATTPVKANDDTNIAPRGVTMNGNLLDNDQGDDISIKEITYMDSNGDMVTAYPSESVVIYATDKEGKPVKAGTLTVGDDGEYQFVPHYNFVGVVPVEYTANNMYGDESSGMLYLTSLKVIEPPIIVNDDIAQVVQDEPVSGNLLTNDIGEGLYIKEMTGLDQEGKPLEIPTNGTATTIYDKDGSKSGTVKVDVDGNFTFTPEPGFSGNVPLDYIVGDTDGNEEGGKLILEILPVYDPLNNNPPVVQDVYTTTDKNKPAKGSLISSDNDPDGDALTVTHVDIPGVGKVEVPASGLKDQPVEDGEGNVIGKIDVDPDGNFKFTPENNYLGQVPSIGYTVCDGGNVCDDAELNLRVMKPGMASADIIVRDDAHFAPQGKPIGGNVKDNDEWYGTDAKITEVVITVDGKQVSFDITESDPQDLIVDGKKIGRLEFDTETGEYYLVPQGDFAGSIKVEYTVENEEGVSSSASLTLTSTPIKALATDAINQVVSGVSTEGNLMSNDRGEGLVVDEITVIGEDGLPKTVAVPDKKAVTTDLYTIDENGDAVKAGTITIDKDGNYTFVPEEGYTGDVPVEYSVKDKYGYSDSGQLTVAVMPQLNPALNNMPMATPDVVAVQKGQSIVIDPLKNDIDIDGDEMKVTEIRYNDFAISTDSNSPTTIEVDGATAGTAYMDSDGRMVFEAADDFTGKVPSFDYIVTDIRDDTTTQLTDSSTISITVTTIPLSSIVVSDTPHFARPGKTMTGNVGENDDWGDEEKNPKVTKATVRVDGQDITITIGESKTIANVGTVTINEDGTYTFVPVDSFIGTLPVTYTVTNDDGQYDTGTLYLTTLSENRENYWMGGVKNKINDWSVDQNWTAHFVPDEGEDVVFATVDNYGADAVDDLHLDKDRIIGHLVNDSDKDLYITVGNQLTINGEMKDNNSEKGTIIIKADPEVASGTLWFADTSNGKNADVEATVEFINLADECTNCGFYRREWQYFGIPVQGGDFPFRGESVVPGETVRKWDEPTDGDKWLDITTITPSEEMMPFMTYEITSNSKNDNGDLYRFEGLLNVGNRTLTMSKTPKVNYSGVNLLANSYTAAIPISEAAILNSGSALTEKTVYLFNRGTTDQWRKTNGGAVSGTSGGQYTAVPFELSGEKGLPDRIPSMHSFMVHTKSDKATIELEYSELVKNAVNEENYQPAWRVKGQNQEYPYIIMDVIGDNSADRVWLFEESSATTGFDNGWDGYKIVEEDLMQVYAIDADHNKLQVSTVPDFEGVSLAVAVCNNESYTISVSAHTDVDARRLYLHDTFTGHGYLLRDGMELTISEMYSTNQSRFEITASSLPAAMTEGSLINTYVRNNTIVVENRSDESATVSVYDIAGRFVGEAQIDRDEMKFFPELSMIKDVIVVKVVSESGAINRSDRVLLK